MARLALVSLVLGLSLVGAASGVGPSLGTLDGPAGVESPDGAVSYATTVTGGHTVLTRRVAGAAARSSSLDGAWGIPRVTLNGAAGGLSQDGTVLVLGDDTPPGGGLRPRSAFAVIDPRTLTIERTIRLRGDYSFDALSPGGLLLYLIQHASSADLSHYRVRAYDLRAGRLLPGVVADKRQAGWTMSGFPVARATSPGGRWVYTLYDQGDNYPFVHALDTEQRRAICIGLPWDWSRSEGAIGAATIALAGGELRIAGGRGSSTRFLLDVRTWRVAAAGEHTTT